MKNQGGLGAGESLFDRIAFWTALIAAFLLPAFFIPSNSFPFLTAKTLIFAVAAIVPFLAWVLRSFRTKSAELPKAGFLFAFLVVVLATILSALFSPAPWVSLIGDGFEMGTAASLLLMGLAIVGIPPLFADRKRIFYFYLAFLASFVLIALFHLARFAFGPSFLSLGVFGDITSNPVGKWYELAILSGLAALLSAITLGFMPLGRRFRVLFSILLGLALLLLAFVNFSLAWIMLAIGSLGFLIFFFVKSGKSAALSKRIPAAFAAILLISLVFIGDQAIGDHFQGRKWKTLGEHVSGHFHISALDARPQWSLTASISKTALRANPVFGVGPNRFVNSWLSAKPAAVNQTIFWNTDFQYGIGFIPSFLATTGILGGLAWLVFLALFLWSGWKALVASRSKDSFSRYLIVSSFSGTLFLWAMAFFYVPGNVSIGLAALWTGIYASVLISEGIAPSFAVSFGKSSLARWIGIALLALGALGSIGLGYVFARKTAAAAYFQAASSALSSGDLAKADYDSAKAVSYSKTGTYYRAETTVALYRLRQTVSDAAADKNGPSDAAKKQFNDEVGAALNASIAAKDSDPTDYRNWASIGTVYEALIPFGISNSYQNALAAFSQAQALNPQGPSMELNLAQLELANKDNKDNSKAKQHIAAALAEKSDYLDAVYLLAQVQLSEKDTASAIKSLVYATQITPNDPVLLYQIGLLVYGQADYKDAAIAFGRAVSLNASYSNALYYLGLTYDKLGDAKNALAAFQQVAKLNPGNAELNKIIANLQAGKAALSGVSGAVPQAPAAATTTPAKPKAAAKK